MKKTYIQPQIEAYAVATNNILEDSLEVKIGNTGEQNAKLDILSFEFDDFNEELLN